MTDTETKELTIFYSIEATLVEVKAENKLLVFDYADNQGSKDAKSHIAKLRKVKTRIADVHKTAKADALAFGRRLDARKNELTGEVDSMINVHKEPLDRIEAEKTAIALAKAEALAKEKADAEAKKQAELDAREAEIRAKEQEIWEAEDKLRREQEALAQKEREKKIAEDAAENARQKAEEKAAAAAALAKAQAKAKELAEKKRKEAEALKEKKRMENTKHRQEVEDKILVALSATILDNKVTFKVLTAIKENKIPNVTIIY